MSESFKKRGYYENVERPVDADLGFKVVQFLFFAHKKGADKQVIYRPLNPDMFVYKEGDVDYCTPEEFAAKYRLITEPQRILELDALCRELYPEG
jgi:hypothetical protein